MGAERGTNKVKVKSRNAEQIKQMLPYAGIPFVCCVLFLIWPGEADAFTLLKFELLLITGYIAAIVDLKTMSIPNSLILTMLAAWAILMTPKLFLDAETGIRMLKDSALGFAIGGGLFFLVYLISRKGLGGGDVKFMAAAGMYLGFWGTLPAMFLGSLTAGLTGLALVLLKKISSKDKMPLAPFLYIGIMITVFMQ